MIKEKMVDHLENQGFQNVPVNRTTDVSEPGLSSEAETARSTTSFIRCEPIVPSPMKGSRFFCAITKQTLAKRSRLTTARAVTTWPSRY